MSNGPDKPMLPELQILVSSGLISSITQGPIWQYIGPTTWRGVAQGSFQAGSMNQVSIDPMDTYTIYASSYDGGLWRLPNVFNYPKVRWQSLTDTNTNITLRTCSFAIAPSDNSVIYLADGLGRVLKSEDRGNSWNAPYCTLLRYENQRWRRVAGNNRFNYIRKILVHPEHPNIVYVASDQPNHIWYFIGGQSGFWKSTDSGITWKEIHPGVVSDAAMDPRDSSIIYIGVRGEGLFKTHTANHDTIENSSITWDLIFPFSQVAVPPNADYEGGRMIKVALGGVGGDSNRLVAVKFHKQLFINHNGGRNSSQRYVWERNSWDSKGEMGQYGPEDQSNFTNVIAVAPYDNEIILNGLQDLYRRTVGMNGAESWQNVAGYSSATVEGRSVHPDMQNIEFDRTPSGEGVVYLANDGGVYRSVDGGQRWSELNQGLFTGQVWVGAAIANNVAVAAFYHQGLSVSPDASSDSSEWIVLTGGGQEFTPTVADPKRRNVFYAFQHPESLQQLTLDRYTYSYAPTPTLNVVTIGSFTTIAIAVDTMPNSKIILASSIEPTAIKRTFDGDANNPRWTDETVNNLDPNEQITSISFAPSNPRMAYAISNLGKVFRKDNVSSLGVDNEWVNMGQLNTTSAKQVLVNPRDSNRIYILSSNTVSLSENGGVRFNADPIHGSEERRSRLPTDRVFRSLISHPLSPGTLYLASETGVFATTNEGTDWHPFDSGLPKAEIKNIAQDCYLYAATKGRGLWRTRLPLIPSAYFLPLRT